MFHGVRCLLLFATLAWVSGFVRAADRLELKEGDRILFIGDTFFEREVNYGHLEARLAVHGPVLTGINPKLSGSSGSKSS